MMARERFNPASTQPRRNHETSAQVSFLRTQEVLPQQYPVYDPQYALLSLRSWGSSQWATTAWSCSSYMVSQGLGARTAQSNFDG